MNASTYPIQLPSATFPRGAAAMPNVSAGLLFLFLSILFWSAASASVQFLRGEHVFALAQVASLCLQVALWYLVVRSKCNSIILKFLYVHEMLRMVTPIAAVLSLPENEMHHYPWGEFLFAHPFRASAAPLIRPLSVLLVIPFIKKSPPGLPQISLSQIFTIKNKKFEFFLLVAALVQGLFWLSLTGITNIFLYLIRIWISTFYMVPFFVGYCAFKYKKVAIIWIVLMGLEVLASFITGTRGVAFRLILMFSAGFFIGLPSWGAKIRWALISLPLFYFLFVSAVQIGRVRDVVGRTDLHTALRHGTVLSAMGDDTVTREVNVRGNKAFEAFRRTTLWPNYVVPVMSPDYVALRGFHDFGEEFWAQFNLGLRIFSGTMVGQQYFGNYYLRRYGFAVHVGDRQVVSNVENPAHIDAYSRGGWLWAVFVAFLSCLVLAAFERKLFIRYIHQNPAFFMQFVMFLTYILVRRFGSGSVLRSFRQLVLEGVFLLVVYTAISLFYDSIIQPGSHSRRDASAM